MSEKEVKCVLLCFCWSVLWGSHLKRSVGVESKTICLWNPARSTALPLTKRNCFSPISPVPCMRTGLLFLTSISYTDPDQFVYKTQPPRERPDTSPDVRMNSYLGLWPLRWQINCLGHGHLKNFFWFIQSINLPIFYFISNETHTKSMPWSSSAAKWFSALGSVILPCSKLGDSSYFQFTSQFENCNSSGDAFYK